MRFSILHSSARPDRWKEVRDAWAASCDNPESVEYVLVCDRRWGFDALPEHNEDWRRIKHMSVWNTGRRCYVDGVNIAAQYATGDVLIVIADDQFPCEHWDTELEKAIQKAYDGMLSGWESRDHVVVEVNTGTTAEHERGIMVMPILSRARYEKLGYVFYPEYESMYADNDFCEMARRDGVVIDARHLTFPHEHPLMKPDLKWDAQYGAQNRKEAYALGLQILEKRRQNGFTEVGHVPSVALKEVKQKPKLAVMLAGENFSQPFVGAWTELVTALGVTFDVYVTFGYSSNVYFTRQQMSETILNGPHKYEYVLWIDDDQILTYDNFKLLFRDLQDHPEYEGIVGWAWCQNNYYASSIPMMSCGYIGSDGKPVRFTQATMFSGTEDVKEIDFSGFPAALLRGDTMDKVNPEAFMPVIDREQFPPYGVSGEDAGFFYRARAKGLKFAVDRRVKVPHLKMGFAEPASLDMPVPAVRAT